jgi:hypothetical protein
MPRAVVFVALFTIGSIVVSACVGEDPSSPSTVVVTPDGGPPGPDTSCPSGQHKCGDKCVSNDDVATCGTSCTPCATPAGGKATCTQGACGIACDAPHVACGNACVDTKTDKAHCGRCNRACGDGSTCADALCSTTTIVQSVNGLQEIGVVGAKVILATSSDILEVAATGGTPKPIFADTNATTNVTQKTLVVDLNNVYFGGSRAYNGGSVTVGIFKLALAGGSAPSAIAPFALGTSASVDGTVAAWVAGSNIRSCVAGTQCATEAETDPTIHNVAPAPTAFAVLVSGTTIVFSQPNGAPTSSGIFTLSTTGTAPRPTTKLATMQNPQHLRVHAGVVYFIDDGGDDATFGAATKPAVYACALAGCGGTPTRLYTQADALGELAVDASGVYVSNPVGKNILVLRSLTKADQTPEVLAKDIARPRGIALDGTNAYFVNETVVDTTFAVLRVAK